MESSTKILLFSILYAGCQETTETVHTQPSVARSEGCEDIPWTYQNVGDPFMRTWCASCHHVDLPQDQRAGSPLGVNFHSYTEVISQLERIQARTLSEPMTMPPAGGPSDQELNRLREWIDCGAPQ